MVRCKGEIHNEELLSLSKKKSFHGTNMEKTLMKGNVHTHCCSKCDMEPSCFTKSCFLNVLTIIVKQSLGCLKHSLQWKTGQCLQRIYPCFHVLSPRCNFIIYKNRHFPPARGKKSLLPSFAIQFLLNINCAFWFLPHPELFAASAKFPHMNKLKSLSRLIYMKVMTLLFYDDYHCAQTSSGNSIFKRWFFSSTE